MLEGLPEGTHGGELEGLGFQSFTQAQRNFLTNSRASVLYLGTVRANHVDQSEPGCRRSLQRAKGSLQEHPGKQADNGKATTVASWRCVTSDSLWATVRRRRGLHLIGSGICKPFSLPLRFQGKLRSRGRPMLREGRRSIRGARP